MRYDKVKLFCFVLFFSGSSSSWGIRSNLVFWLKRGLWMRSTRFKRKLEQYTCIDFLSFAPKVGSTRPLGPVGLGTSFLPSEARKDSYLPRQWATSPDQIPSGKRLSLSLLLLWQLRPTLTFSRSWILKRDPCAEQGGTDCRWPVHITSILFCLSQSKYMRSLGNKIIQYS